MLKMNIVRDLYGKATDVNDINEKDILNFLTTETGKEVPVSREEFEDLKTVLLVIFLNHSTVNPQLFME
jgi:hypothetical protein